MSVNTPEQDLINSSGTTVWYTGNLTDQLKATLETKLKERFGDTKIQYVENPSLLGGIVIVHQGVQYDLSLKGKLNLINKHIDQIKLDTTN
jgi:F0F1-type ATP synthase delta subunit